jgi:predicted RNA-binding Zn ribbon-like protein
VDLEVVEQFLNTLDERTFSVHGTHHVAGDELTSVEALSRWLEAHRLTAHDHELGPSDLAAARSLRAALRGSLTGRTDAAAALTGFPLRLEPEPSGALRIVAASGVPGVDAIVETVAVSIASGRWARLKLCASPDCHWAFYDTSRSGGGRWCSMEICGNRHKTRTYRQRQQADDRS